MRHRPGAFLALIVLTLAAPATAAPVPGGDVTVTITGMRSAKGQVLACLTTRADAFPDCAKDPLARKLTVPAGVQGQDLGLDFGRVPDGQYAISLVHDENGNGKLDTRLMIPREGYGFSRNAPVRMGPPRFANAVFAVSGGNAHLAIKMRYLL